ncbi:amidohydrolase family protein [Streptomyces sp. B6B3]|uniref:amidohydrolase family protein n=1 Tax=Streptomyces sp. B6B3 TaxID=3153570 RepID=UPI00325CD5E8
MSSHETPDAVDAHHHYWRPASDDPHPRPVQGVFGPDELVPELAAAGVAATVLVQSVDDPRENDRLAAYAAAVPEVAGTVAWLPLADPVAARAELRRVRVLGPTPCGVRCLVERDPLEWLTTPDSLSLFRELADRGLCWDVVPVTEPQLRAVTELAAAVPELRIVVDHLARPPLETGRRDLASWARRLGALAEHPGVALKVSVGVDALTAWPRWDAAELVPYVARAAELFGPRRLMLASNWPVVLLRRDYPGTWADLTAALRAAGVAGRDLAEATGGTAARWYRLG